MKGRERLRWAFAWAGAGALALINHACAETTCEETRTCTGASTGGAGGAGGTGGAGASDAGGTGGIPPVGSFAISVESTTLTLIDGESLEVTVTITRNAMTDPITLDFLGLPTGATADPVVAPAGFKSAKVIIQADSDMVHGPAKVTLRAQGGGQEKTLDLDLLARGPAGSIDNSFGAQGVITENPYGAWSRGRAAALAPDGKIYVVGDAGSTAGDVKAYFVARYSDAGVLDPSFGTSGVVTRHTTVNTGEHVARGVFVDAQQRVVVGGYFTGNNVFFARFDTAGALDPSFATTGEFVGPGGSVSALAQSGTKLLAAGKNDQTPAHALVARMDGSGAPDTAFGTQALVIIDTGTSASEAVAVAVDADNKIVLAGTTTKPGTPVFVARLTPGGAMDSFGTAGVAYLSPLSGAETTGLVVRPDKRVVVGGGNAAGEDFVVQLDAQGAVDTSFGASGKAMQGAGRILALDGAGRIVTASKAGTALRLGRLLQDGSADTSFGSLGYSWLTYPADPHAVILLPDGRALVVGVSKALSEDKVFVGRFWM